MVIKSILEKANQHQLKEDESALGSDKAKLGEGANTSVHFSPRGYVVKPVNYGKNTAQNPNEPVEDPENHLKRVDNLERFPWAELEKLETEDQFNHAWVRMSAWDLSHNEAMETYHISDVIQEDLDLFISLRDDNITYSDFKPDNIGYFWEGSHESKMPVAKAIDITDGVGKPWKVEEYFSWRDFSDVLDVYIRGTPDEEGVIDRYPVQAQRAEEYVLDYLGLDAEVTGDPYKDFFTVFDQHSSKIESQINSNSS
ncbi:MAG: hypothetical protein ABEK16_05025 [Candidatus Nanohalobium sp.]